MKLHTLTPKQAAGLEGFMPPDVRRLPEREEFWYLAASEAGAGFLGLAVLDPRQGESELLSIAVSPPYQRRGVATELLQLALKLLHQSGEGELRVRYSLEPSAWPPVAGLLEANGFVQDRPERYAYELPLLDLAAYPTVKAAMGRGAGAAVSLSSLSPQVLKAFQVQIGREGLIDPETISLCDPAISYAWVEGENVKACVLFSREEEGVLDNLWTYLGSNAQSQWALPQTFACAVKAALEQYPPETTSAFFACENEASQKLICHLAPGAEPVQVLREYTRPTAFDSVPRSAGAEQDLEEQEENEEVMTMSEEDRAKRWADVYFTPVTDSDLYCARCAHRIEGELLRCKKYLKKPGAVLYGDSCPKFEAQPE